MPELIKNRLSTYLEGLNVNDIRTKLRDSHQFVEFDISISETLTPESYSWPESYEVDSPTFEKSNRAHFEFIRIMLSDTEVSRQELKELMAYLLTEDDGREVYRKLTEGIMFSIDTVGKVTLSIGEIVEA